MTTPSDRLMALRAATGLSETGFAHYLGVPIHTLKKWLSGQRMPTSAALRLIEVLEVLQAIAPGIVQHLIPQGIE